MYQSDKVQLMVEQLSRLNPFYGKDGLADPARPDEKSIPRDIPSLEQVPFIQKQLDLLTYNHLPHTFFNLEKHRALQSILMTGKEALTEALPIRCLEATFVGMYLTQDNKDLDRFPLSFRSAVGDAHYQHIVLVIHTRQPTPLFGALGLSRKRTLMYKPMEYHSLYDLVRDFKHEYEVLGHELVDIKLGLLVSHEQYCRVLPCWRFVALKLALFAEPAAADGSPRAVPPLAVSSQGDAEGSLPPPSPSQQAAKAAASASGSTFHGPAGPADSATAGRTAGGVGGTAASPHAPTAFPLNPPSAVRRQSSSGIVIPCASGSSSTAGGSECPALANFLVRYSALLPIMSEQYYKGLPTVDVTNRGANLCFLSLEEAERDAKAENTRRMELIAKQASPLSAEARKAAGNRQLKSGSRKKKRSQSQQRTTTSATKRAVTASAPKTARSVASPRGSRTGRPSPAPAPALVSVSKGAPVTRPYDGMRPLRTSGMPVELNASCGTIVRASSSEMIVADDSGYVELSPTAASGVPAMDNVAPKTLASQACPPTPRNDTSLPSSSSSFSFSSSPDSSLSDSGFLREKNHAEGGQ